MVASEGSITEKVYFDHFGDTRVQVKTLPSFGGRSSPEHVLSNLKKFSSEYDLGEGDELWLVIDVDRWTLASLRTVCAACVQDKINIAVSNPCFELWLCLHLEGELPDFKDTEQLTRLLRAELGSFNKNKYDAEKLVRNVRTAIKRAKSLDRKQAARWPDRPGSHVYKLVTSIVKKYR
ncbi:RloB family protein [Rhizobium sp. Leaf341]|uniref:RloB family protein n=1 Tax=Rhizobium sp. Leaf341 TaxID=1736344 RepID=UPI001FCD010C|nr:RloB family protein [Rhizobium sp. Leaf341]